MDFVSMRNLKDFLQVYNSMAEKCFVRCTQTFNARGLTDDEIRCVDLCTLKHINVNHKVMQVYVEVQPLIVNSRMEEMSKKQASLEANQALEAQTNIETVQKTDTQIDTEAAQIEAPAS